MSQSQVWCPCSGREKGIHRLECQESEKGVGKPLKERSFLDPDDPMSEEDESWHLKPRSGVGPTEDE